jgi:gluconolactonase
MTPRIPIERFEVFASNLDHPECVAFDRDGNLWAGGEAGQVYRIDPAGKVELIANLGSFNGGLAFSPEDELFVCNPALGVVHVDRAGKHSVYASEIGGRKLICPNYPVFDRAGRLYVSDSGNWKKQNGALVRIDSMNKGQVIGGPFGYANGLALSADERSLFMVESNTNRVLRFDLKADGTLGNQHVHATETGWLPDGLAIDSDDNLYVSCYASDDIHQITGGGVKTLFAFDPFAILLSRPTNMAFHDGWIYVANLGRTTITRANVGIVGQKLANQP